MVSIDLQFWHFYSGEKIAGLLETDLKKGLSKKQAVLRRKKFGANKLPKKIPLSDFSIFCAQFKNPLIYILIIASFFSLFFRLYTDFAVIFFVVIFNSLIGYFQEKKANKALDELNKIIKVFARVIRNGNQKKINAENLVPGDIIILRIGDKIPADCRLTQTDNLKINESPLTGESQLAEKHIKILPKNTDLADRDNMAYMGCIVESGSGKAIVVQTNKQSEIGKIAEMLNQVKEEKTPIQKKIAGISSKIGIIIVFLCFFIFIGGIMRGFDFLEMFEIAVAVAVAAIPEGLPIAFTVILTIGMTKILKKKGLVRKLISAETLGSASVIATDKTLTLTQGKMKVSEVVSARASISADIDNWQENFKLNANQEHILAMEIAVLCSAAYIENPQENSDLWKIQGSPTDKAFVFAGAETGLLKPKLEQKFPKISEIPFNEKNKFIATLSELSENENLLYVSGAPEKVFGLSAYFEDNAKQKKIDKKSKENFLKILDDLTSKGLRVTASAYKKIDKNKFGNKINLREETQDLIFVGFIAMKDPLRKQAKNAIKLCAQAGIRPIMITGDHLLTAKSVAKELGFKINKNNIIEGKDIDIFSDKEFKRKAKHIQVYARVEPRHKEKIIQTLQEKGEVVAMTGDGINDAPAMKSADIGIALGSGTDTAKQVCDLVLLTDDFNIIILAIEQGRAVIDNLRKVITYLLSDSFTETILIGTSIIFGFPLPITAVQILYINLIEDGFLGIVLAFEPKEKGLMLRKPEPKNISILTKEMKVIIFIISIITDLILLCLFFWLYQKNYNMAYVQTMIFASLSIGSFFYIFSCKSLRKNIWDINIFSNKFLILAWIVSLLCLLIALYLPFMQTLLKTVPLGFSDWMILITLGAINITLIEITKYYFIRKNILQK